MTTQKTQECRDAEDALVDLIEGTASAAVYDHVAGCDHCRDLRHDAARAIELASAAGGDFVDEPGFAARVLARALEARPDVAAGASDERASRPVSGESPVASAPAPATVAPVASEPSASEPVAPAASAAREHTLRSVEPVAVVAEVAQIAPKLVESAPTPVAARDDAAPPAGREGAGDTEISPREHVAPAKTDHEHPEHHDVRGELAALGSSKGEGESEGGSERELGPAAVEGAPASHRAPVVAKTDARRPFVLAMRDKRKIALGAVGSLAALAAAAALVVYGGGKPKDPDALTEEAKGPWAGKVASLARASADKTGGFEVCKSGGACSAVERDAEIPVGAVLKTDAKTRAHVALADGTTLALDRGTEVELIAKEARSLRLKQGAVVVDVASGSKDTKSGLPNAKLYMPNAEIEVLGTKLALTASGEDRGAVEVARGSARVKIGGAGDWSEVRAGEEASLSRQGGLVIASSSSIADSMDWSERSSEELDAPVLKGLGELRARKPGQTQEKERAVKLSRHSVKVRVVDLVARTEVDETFTNETDEELEGIYRFPLPPGASIERLALEVDGKLIEGAFVDRDKGAAIWRGVIQNAAPKAQKTREEIIWVPGPWRDPALLEWQRGGRFELRIFPIPKRGSRRVVLTYTQTVDQSAGVRRFTYPLAHDANGTTTVGQFDLDVQVTGLDKATGLQTRGYELVGSASNDGMSERKTLSAANFVPAGDLTVEYALPDAKKGVTAWAYKATPTTLSVAEPTATQGPGGWSRHNGFDKRPVSAPPDVDGRAIAAGMLADPSAYVAISLRPKLPRWEKAKPRLHVIVVDSSRSMVGERYARAIRLAGSMVREMDRRDSFVVMACDTSCQTLANNGESAGLPGAAAAGDVEKFLGGIEPDGGSDLAAAMTAARSAAGRGDGRELRVIYLGDGTPSIGPTKPSHIEAAVRSALPSGDGGVIAVALGADADLTSLGALARGGGGVVVPYVPGQKVSTAALEVLSAAYGSVLRDPEVELPAGLTQITPSRLDPVRAGGETIVLARMSGDQAEGTVKIRGTVAGERFEQSYPLKVVASTSVGNAFVPRLFAAAKIAEIERSGGDAMKGTAIELSKHFAVASRYTSMIVLESEAMFKAFGLDRHQQAATFTGETGAESSSGESEEALAAAADEKNDGQGFSTGYGRLGGGAAKKGKAADVSNSWDGPSSDDAAPRGAPGAPMAQAAPAPMAPSEPRAEAEAAKPSKGSSMSRAPSPSPSWRPPPPRNMIPMRRVWDRKVAFESTNALALQNASRVGSLEQELKLRPDSRDKTTELYAMYATTGQLGPAQELTSRWAGRDALDPDALVARADLAARQGDRDRAVRVLTGLADVRPGDKLVQSRLAELFEAAGRPAQACQHRVALADIASSDAKAVAEAVRCSRSQGLGDLANVLLGDVTSAVRTEVERVLTQSTPTTAAPFAGDVRVTAEWSGGGDVDVALIDDKGRRISWFGVPTNAKYKASAESATAVGRETLVLQNLPAGAYAVEITRSSASSTEPVRGEVTLRLGNETRKIPFSMVGPRTEVGTVRVSFTSRLVPVDDGSSWRNRPLEW